ncbi:hypothetical protein F2Q70_00020097 [Brassica cretica]|uniref:Uncharacterized protein n=1 Tax=Brassica cretica TaxID=69181 RepID=A0A8S9GPR5_BRACR|nr:hypothetical protein F2Q70_00020097 [Brassica cretica]
MEMAEKASGGGGGEGEKTEMRELGRHSNGGGRRRRIEEEETVHGVAVCTHEASIKALFGKRVEDETNESASEKSPLPIYPIHGGKYLTLLPRNKLVTNMVPSSLEQYTNKNISVVGAGGDHKPNGRNALNPQRKLAVVVEEKERRPRCESLVDTAMEEDGDDE